MKLLDYIKLYNEIKKNKKDYKKILKIYIMSSWTINQIEPILAGMAFEYGYKLDIKIGGYDQWIEETLNPDSELYKFNPDIVILASRPEDFYLNLTVDKKDYKEYLLRIENILNKLSELNFQVIVNNFLVPSEVGQNLFDYKQEDSEINFIRKLNFKLLKILEDKQNINLVDIENLASKFGKNNIIDNKMWWISKNPYKIEFFYALSEEYVKYILAGQGEMKKCIVLDLDNTLWGGIVGEDGFNGIKLGEGYPGNTYVDFQKELYRLNKRGIILAINSKNNYDDAMKVIEKHPNMILRKENFATFKINWKNKAENLLGIAEELNIGLNSIVFIDDNPIECDLVSKTLPEVEVINVSPDLNNHIEKLYDYNFFITLNITEEDLKKSVMYKSQVERKKEKEKYIDLEDYYRSLNMKIKVEEADGYSIPRISQLTQKTNQFNLTTKRYTERDIRELLNKNFKIWTMKTSDKFGDSGLTGVMIIDTQEENWLIDTFLMSCRVMGRNLEYAFMKQIILEARKNNMNNISGKYIKTNKNKPVENLYRNMGFKYFEEEDIFIYDLKKRFKSPDYIERIE